MLQSLQSLMVVPQSLQSQVVVLQSHACWLNDPRPPPGPPRPKPPPAPPPPPQPDPSEDGLLAFCQWGTGRVAASQRWVVDGGRVRQGSICLERPAATALGGGLTLATCRPGEPTQVFDTNGHCGCRHPCHRCRTVLGPGRRAPVACRSFRNSVSALWSWITFIGKSIQY